MTSYVETAAPCDFMSSVVPSSRRHSWSPSHWFGRTAASVAPSIPHIVHIEIDAFFASVEQLLNPKLAGKPVLVGRGVVASASYEAKLRGVKPALSFADALHICPKAIIVEGQYRHYADFAERIRRILETYTPVVQPAALDDFYLDFASIEQRHPEFETTLRRMQSEILTRTGLSVSLGAARTKAVACVASRLERPHGFRVVQCGMEQAFLWSLPVEKLNGIGQIHAAKLAKRGITTIRQLRGVPKPALNAEFGEVIGGQIWESARGRDAEELKPNTAPKSVSRETTIEGGTLDRELLAGMLQYLTERVRETLYDHGNQGRTLGLSLRYVDGSSADQTVCLTRSTNDSRELLTITKELFAKLCTRNVAIRHLALRVTSLLASSQQNAVAPTARILPSL